MAADGWTTNTYRGSVKIRLLPFMERRHIYDPIDFNVDTDGQCFARQLATNPADLDPRISLPECQRRSLDSLGVAGDNYAASCGPTPESWAGSPSCPCDANQFYQPYASHASLSGLLERQSGRALHPQSGYGGYVVPVHDGGVKDGL